MNKIPKVECASPNNVFPASSPRVSDDKQSNLLYGCSIPVLTVKSVLEPVSFFVHRLNCVIRYKNLWAVFCTHSLG